MENILVNGIDISKAELIEKLPCCLLLKIEDKDAFLGYRNDGFIYVVIRADSSVRKERASWKTAWMDNQSWWVFRSVQDDYILSLLMSRIPAWVDMDLVITVLNSKHEDLKTMPKKNNGRYISLRNGDTSTNQVETAWMLDTSSTIEDIQFTPDVKLLYNNNESRFTGHPLQIWSDGVWTRGRFLTGFGEKTKIHEDAATILKFAGKKLGLQIGVENLLRMTWCNKTELAVIEGEQRGFFSSYNEEYRAEKWDTNIGDFYLLFWEWGSFNGEGDAGDDCDVFLTFDEVKNEFKSKTNTHKKIGA